MNLYCCPMEWHGSGCESCPLLPEFWKYRKSGAEILVLFSYLLHTIHFNLFALMMLPKKILMSNIVVCIAYAFVCLLCGLRFDIKILIKRLYIVQLVVVFFEDSDLIQCLSSPWSPLGINIEQSLVWLKYKQIKCWNNIYVWYKNLWSGVVILHMVIHMPILHILLYIILFNY